jgi:AcrR family transcriptional regulator
VRRARRHDDILAAARAVVDEHGYEAATMEAIAVAAGVGKPTLYRWWPNRAALVHEALVAQVLPTEVTDLRGFVTGVLAFFERPLVRKAWLGAMAELAHDPMALAVARSAFLDPAADQLRAIVGDDSGVVVDLVLGAGIAGLLLPGRRPARAARVDAIVAALGRL